MPRRPRVLTGSLAALALLLPAARADSSLRLVTWNVTNYSGGRAADFETAIYGEFEGRSMSPDVIVCQEFVNASGVGSFVAILNNAVAGPGDWAAADFVDGANTDSALFYRTSRVQLATELSPSGVTVVAEGGVSPLHPTNIMRYDLALASGTSVEARLAVYSSHMKSGSDSDDRARRLLEAQRIRDDAEALPAGWHFMLGGDFNIPSSGEQAYQELIGSQPNNAGRFFDPINSIANWHNNAAYRFLHTQDPVWAMDDRFDQFIVSASLIDGLGVDYIGNAAIPYSTSTWDDPHHSYRCWGNDGTSYDLPLTIAGNQMVGPLIAQALENSAVGGGHLPVLLDLRIPPCRGDVACDGDTDSADLAAFLDCTTGPSDVSGFVSPSPECRSAFDWNEDQDVDLVDFRELQAQTSAK